MNSICSFSGLQVTSSQTFTSPQTLEIFRLWAVLPRLSAVMKIWRLLFEKLSFISAGHVHGGQTREDQAQKLKNMPLIWENTYRDAYYCDPIRAIRLVSKYPVAALFQLEVLKPPKTSNKATNPQTSQPFTEVLQYMYFRQFCLCTRNPAPPINKYLSTMILFWVAK